MVADAYPNFSICGIPYYVSGEVTHWRNLAHRTYADLEAAGMRLRLDTTARKVDVAGRTGAPDRAGRRRRGRAALRPARHRHRRGPRPAAHRRPGRARAGKTGCTCCTRWTTPSRSCGPWRKPAPAARSSSGPATSGWRWPRACRPAAWPSPSWSGCPRCCRPSIRSSARWSARSSRARRHRAHRHRRQGAISPRRARERPERLRVDAVTSGGEPVTVHADLVLVVTGVRPETDLAVSAGASLGATRRHRR